MPGMGTLLRSVLEEWRGRSRLALVLSEVHVSVFSDSSNRNAKKENRVRGSELYWLVPGKQYENSGRKERT
jgi:hypothetical protein